jgi:hypothetical protein
LFDEDGEKLGKEFTTMHQIIEYVNIKEPNKLTRMHMNPENENGKMLILYLGTTAGGFFDKFYKFVLDSKI